MKTLLLGDLSPTASTNPLFEKHDIETLFSDTVSVFENNDITYQLSELGKVDLGGGGTIAYIMAEYGMNVIDSGVAVLNMHAPWEIISKVDLYEAYKGYVAFLKEA